MTPEQERQYQEVQERLENIIKDCPDIMTGKPCLFDKFRNRDCIKCKVNAILSNPTIRIEDADQTITEDKYFPECDYYTGFKYGQKSMAGFVRVLPRDVLDIQSVQEHDRIIGKLEALK